MASWAVSVPASPGGFAGPATPGTSSVPTTPEKLRGTEDQADVDTPSRAEKSLGILTSKFVKLLQEAPNGVIDLKTAAEQLAVRQKRRIYDITNVLEGIGLIEKNSKNMIRWKGEGPRSNTVEIAQKLEGVRKELQELDKQENQLDEHRANIEQSLKALIEIRSNAQLAYITHNDVQSLPYFKDQTLIAVKAPSKAQLVVPEQEKDGDSFTMHLRSRSGPIEALLFYDGEDGCSQGGLGALTNTVQNGKAPRAASPPAQRKKARVDAAASGAAASNDAVAISAEGSPSQATNAEKEERSGTLIRLSPPPLESDYSYALEDNEGVFDLYNVDDGT